MDDIQSTLIELGLNAKEISVYLALLRQDSAPASIIAKQVDITRSTAQYTCKQLQKKGLISMSQKDNKFLYYVQSPQNILTLLKGEQDNLDKKKSRVSSILDSLEAMRKEDVVLPKVRFFEGVKGIRKAYNELYDSMDGDEVLLYEHFPIEIDKHFNLKSVFNEAIQKRITSHTHIRTITTTARGKGKTDVQYQSELRQTRIISHEHFPIMNSDFFIYKNMVVSHIYDKDNPHAFIITSPFTAQLQRAIFELLWKKATPSAHKE